MPPAPPDETPSETPEGGVRPEPAPPPVIGAPAWDPIPEPTHRTISEGGSAWLIPFYLLFRPGFFFLRYGAACPIGVTLVLLWVAAVSGTADRLEIQFVTNPEAIRTVGVDTSWAVFWAFALGVSFCSMGVIALLRVGWYWLRLLMCGVRKPSFGVAMNLFTLSSMIMSLPSVAYFAWATSAFDTPREYHEHDSLWVLVVGGAFVLAALWSIWSSYRGVRAVFDAKRLPTVIWFLILPWIAQLLMTAVGFIVMWFAVGVTPPDLDNPKTYESELYTFDYPGNWSVDDAGTAIADGGRMVITPDIQDAMIRIDVYEPTDEPADELDIAADGFNDETDFTLTPGAPIARIGAWEGVGRRYQAHHTDGGDYIAELLVVELTEWYNADILLLYLPADEPVIRAGIDHVLDSLKMHTPDRKPTSLADAYHITSGPVRALIPGNWSWSTRSSGGSRTEEIYHSLEVYPHAEGILRIMQYATDQTLEEEVQRTIEQRIGSLEILSRAPTATWGSLKGAGEAVRYKLEDGSEYRLTVVIAPAGEGRVIEVQRQVSVAAQPVVDPGYMFIEKTLEIE